LKRITDVVYWVVGRHDWVVMMGLGVVGRTRWGACVRGEDNVTIDGISRYGLSRATRASRKYVALSPWTGLDWFDLASDRDAEE
jgi:hypothetical protein